MANNRTPERERRRELLFKEPGQEYAQVIRVLGDKRMGLRCFDNVERVGHIRGSLRVWINLSDIVLVSLRDFDPTRADIVHKYTTEEARSLQALGELPASVNINATAIDMERDGEDEESGITFEDI